MNCPDRDSEILLLAHRQSDVASSTITLLHLMHCSRCRTQYQRFVQVQMVLIRGTRTAFGITSVARPLLPGWAVLITLLALITMLFGALIGSPLFSEKKAHISAPSQTRPCRPDLPSDRCN